MKQHRSDKLWWGGKTDDLVTAKNDGRVFFWWSAKFKVWANESQAIASVATGGSLKVAKGQHVSRQKLLWPRHNSRKIKPPRNKCSPSSPKKELGASLFFDHLKSFKLIKVLQIEVTFEAKNLDAFRNGRKVSNVMTSRQTHKHKRKDKQAARSSQKKTKKRVFVYGQPVIPSGGAEEDSLFFSLFIPPRKCLVWSRRRERDIGA